MLIYDNLVRNEIQLLLKKNLILVNVSHDYVMSFLAHTGYNSAIEVTQDHEALLQVVGIHCSEHIYSSPLLWILQNILSLVQVADYEILACLR